ncbi:MAG TPA: Crp/Fnr family transcriptional regulator [Gammaproteobacteria bacterium]|nr:Crp/Fnr family transcriptional regulator [Gammaproteobacteria bacterium]
MPKRIPLNGETADAARELMLKSVLFGNLEPAQLDTLLQHTRSATLEEGQVLFEQQRPANEIFMLQSGQVKLMRISSEGQEKVIDLISPGNTFAEAIMFSGASVYPVTAAALCASRLLCFDTATYAGILHQSTDACFAIMAHLSRRQHWLISEIDRLTLHNATFRIIAYLLDQIPSTHLGTSEVNLNTPKHVVASRLSMTPETLSRTLSKLNRDGLIEIGEHSIILKDVGQLRGYVQGSSL